MKTNSNWKQLSVVAILVGFLMGCAGEEDSIEVAPLPVVTSAFSPMEIWQIQVGDGVGHYYSRLSPIFAYDLIFAADRNGEVVAIDPATKKRVWQVDLGGGKSLKLSGGLTASYQKIFVGTETGELIALNAQTGELSWRVDVGGEILAKPLADENLVVVHTSRGDLAAFDGQSGEQKWRITTDVPNLTLRGDSAPISLGGGVFWGMANGRLGAAVLQNGNVIWQQVIATPKGASEIDRLVDVDARPVISDTTLYILGYNGQLVAIDLRSGRSIWKRNYSGTQDLILSRGAIYFSDEQDVIYAVDMRSGTELWRNHELKNRQLSSPSLINDFLVFGDAEGYLHWLDLITGDFMAQQAFGGKGIAVPPIRVNDSFLVTTRKGKLYLQTINEATEIDESIPAQANDIQEADDITETEFEPDYFPQIPLN